MLQRLKNLRLSYKLALAFGLVLVLMLIQGIVSFVGMSSIARETDNLVEGTMRSMATANQIELQIGQYRNTSYHMLIRASTEVKQQARDEVAVITSLIDTGLADYERQITEAGDGDPKRRELYDDLVAKWAAARQSYADVNEMIDLDLPEDALDTFLGETSSLHNLARMAANTLGRHDSAAADAAKASVSATNTASNTLVLIVLAAGMLGGTAIAWFIGAFLTRSLRRAVDVADEVAKGNLDNEILVDGDDEIGQLMQALQQMQQDLRERTERDQRIAGENLRIRTALDSSGTSVMIADAQRSIIYANGAVSSLLRQYEKDIHKAVPAFDIDRLIGSGIDAFHSDPEAIARMLEKLEGSHQGEITIGDAHFVQTVARVGNEDGDLLGYVVEWRDRTPQVRVEQELAQVIDAATAGDLSHRIGLEDKHGFYLQLASQLNGLLEANSASLEGVSRILQALADGDLTARMEGDYQGVFAQMRDDANRTTEQLTSLVGSIQGASVAINTASGEIAAGNGDLSRRTEQQAASLEETAASMEELTSTVRQNAEHAHQANQLVIGAADVATRGGQVVGQVVDTMGEIERSSRRIAEIISVIDGIAFQTNILALNAAVEAARAGEQGRGFAVVAAEVRSLAQRSATAAKEIKVLIDDSVEKVATGSSLAGQAGQTMGEMVASVNRVTGIMAEITAASQEQASGIEQVNQTIAQMDETTQQNAALVEEATAAARSMEEQAGQLTHAVSAFKLHDDPGATQAAPAARPAPVAPARAARRPAASERSEKTPRTAVEPALADAGADGDWQEF